MEWRGLAGERRLRRKLRRKRPTVKLCCSTPDPSPPPPTVLPTHLPTVLALSPPPRAGAHHRASPLAQGSMAPMPQRKWLQCRNAPARTLCKFSTVVIEGISFSLCLSRTAPTPRARGRRLLRPSALPAPAAAARAAPCGPPSTPAPALPQCPARLRSCARLFNASSEPSAAAAAAGAASQGSDIPWDRSNSEKRSGARSLLRLLHGSSPTHDQKGKGRSRTGRRGVPSRPAQRRAARRRGRRRRRVARRRRRCLQEV